MPAVLFMLDSLKGTPQIDQFVYSYALCDVQYNALFHSFPYTANDVLQ